MAGDADASYLLKPHDCRSSCVSLGGRCPGTGLVPSGRYQRLVGFVAFNASGGDFVFRESRVDGL